MPGSRGAHNQEGGYVDVAYFRLCYSYAPQVPLLIYICPYVFATSMLQFLKLMWNHFQILHGPMIIVRYSCVCMYVFASLMNDSAPEDT